MNNNNNLYGRNFQFDKMDNCINEKYLTYSYLSYTESPFSNIIFLYHSLCYKIQLIPFHSMFPMYSVHRSDLSTVTKD